MLSLPEWLWVKLKELLGSFFILELDEDRTLEKLLWGTAKTNSIGWTKRSEESFDIELRAWFLVAKTFDVDGARFGLGSRSFGVVGNLALNLLSTFGAADLEKIAFSESSNYCRHRLKSLHATKVANLLNRNWQICRTVGQVPQVPVSWQICVSKVEFDLWIQSQQIEWAARILLLHT
jgi:hypothetical protein